MTLGQIFSGIAEIPEDLRERDVAGVTSDNREVEPGFLFVCVRGKSFDGHNAAAAMLDKGACAVVTERPLGLTAEICVSESRRMYPELLSAFYGRPTRKLCLGAVTGTNGKTTTVNLCAQITRALGHQTGVIGTVGCDTGKGLEYGAAPLRSGKLRGRRIHESHAGPSRLPRHDGGLLPCKADARRYVQNDGDKYRRRVRQAHR